jgi:integrase
MGAALSLAELDLQLRQLKPRPTRYVHRVTDGGLCLRVAPTGRKTWVYRHWIDGREHWVTLGLFPAVPVKEALDRHAGEQGAAVEARKGTGDSPAERAEKRREAKRAEAARPTVADVADQWIKLAVGGGRLSRGRPWSERTKAENKRVLDKDVLGTLGPKRFDEIDRFDCQRVIDAVQVRSPAQALEVFKVMRRMIEFGVERGYRADHPMQRVERPYRYQAKDRALSDAELGAFLRVLEASDVSDKVRACIRLQLFTATRPGEAREADRSEFDVDAAVWTIPAARYKTRRAHRIPLSAPALAIVREMGGEGRGLLFGDMGEAAVHQAIRRMETRLHVEGVREAFTPHDLRRTARSMMARLGVPEEVAERCLGHAQAEMVGTYNVHDYAKETRAAFRRLGTAILAAQARKPRRRPGAAAAAAGKVIRGNFRKAA